MSNQSISAPTLGLTMIVRDEAAVLDRCLASVQGFVNQIVVVDTGSTDDTVAKAQAWGAEILNWAWTDDFAAARNLGLGALSTDWVLVLDADEALVPDIKPAIQASLAQPDLLAVTLIRQEIGVLPPYTPVSRLFRRHDQIFFSRPYHESVDDAVVQVMAVEPQWQIGQLDAVAIQHWGYTPERIQQRDRIHQAAQIMDHYLKTHPEDAYICAKLGGLYLQHGALTQAQATLTQGLQQSNLEPMVAYELHYHLGQLHSTQRDYHQACDHYQAALATPISPLIQLAAHIRLAQAWSQLRHYADAINAYQTVIQIAPEHPLAWQNLGVIYLKLGQIEQSLFHFNQALSRLDQTDIAEAQRLRQELSHLWRAIPKEDN